MENLKKEKMKGFTFNDYIILSIIGLVIITGITTCGWYNEFSDSTDKSNCIENQYNEFKKRESVLNDSIRLKQQEIVELNRLNDSLSLQMVDNNKKIKLNYNKYQNELKKDKNINSIKSANYIVDSILRSKGIR